MSVLQCPCNHCWRLRDSCPRDAWARTLAELERHLVHLMGKHWNDETRLVDEGNRMEIQGHEGL